MEERCPLLHRAGVAQCDPGMRATNLASSYPRPPGRVSWWGGRMMGHLLVGLFTERPSFGHLLRKGGGTTRGGTLASTTCPLLFKTHGVRRGEAGSVVSRVWWHSWLCCALCTFWLAGMITNCCGGMGGHVSWCLVFCKPWFGLVSPFTVSTVCWLSCQAPAAHHPSCRVLEGGCEMENSITSC